MSSFFTTSLGCKLNRYEIEVLNSELKDIGCNFVKENADLCIINTCTVTHVADRKTRKEIYRLIRKNPKAFVVVTGCFAQTDSEILKQINGIDLIVDNNNKDRILDILYDKGVLNRKKKNEIKYHIDRSRPYIKIQDGCNQLCSYCKVRIARGKSRSENSDNIIKTADYLFSEGYNEIVLTGINIGDYNWQGKNLAGLIKEILKKTNNGRIRLSSIEPNDLTDELLEVMKDKRICNYFHIPLQAGSDKILQLMKRPYTRKFYEEKIKKLYDIGDNVIVGSDVIVGFPGETEDDFKDTLGVLKNNNIFYLHIFRYSERKSTEAADFPFKVKEQEKIKRSKIIIDYRTEAKDKFFKTLPGKTVKVVVENKKIDGKYLTSLSDNYISVLIPVEEGRNYIRKIVDVKIIDYVAGKVHGKISVSGDGGVLC